MEGRLRSTVEIRVLRSTIMFVGLEPGSEAILLAVDTVWYRRASRTSLSQFAIKEFMLEITK